MTRIPPELLELFRRRLVFLAWVAVLFVLLGLWAEWLGVADPAPFMVTAP